MKETTLLDIARELNFSESTVSRALKDHPSISQKTKKRIREFALEKGFRANNFASNLAGRKKTKTIGLIVHKLNSYFIASALSSIENIITAAGYDLIIAQSSEFDGLEVNNAINLFQKRVDGLIATLVYTTENLKHFDPFIKKHIPVVFFDRVDKNSKATKVIIDNHAGGYNATAHMIAQGCKRIVIVTAGINGVVPDDRITGTAQRYAGYRAALEDNGIAYQDEYLIVKDFNHENDGLAAAEEILTMSPLPDGAFITNDFHAIVCMKRLMAAGVRVPRDMAIVGFNNDFMSSIVEPPLTTINNPAGEMGEIVAKHLIQQISGNIPISTNNTIILESDLIIRQSSLRRG